VTVGAAGSLEDPRLAWLMAPKLVDCLDMSVAAARRGLRRERGSRRRLAPYARFARIDSRARSRQPAHRVESLSRGTVVHSMHMPSRAPFARRVA
jgi:hypothetical protein